MRFPHPGLRPALPAEHSRQPPQCWRPPRSLWPGNDEPPRRTASGEMDELKGQREAVAPAATTAEGAVHSAEPTARLSPASSTVLFRIGCFRPVMGCLNRGMTQICVCLVGGDHHVTLGSRNRRNSHDTPLPRATAIKVCPSRCSITGFHGTRLNPMPSSSIAKHPLASCTLRR